MNCKQGLVSVAKVKLDTKEFFFNLKEFTDKQLPEEQVVFTKKVSQRVLRSLIHKSPVKTGRFRGAWVVGIGTRDLSEPITVDPIGRVTFARGVRVIIELGEKQTLHISNNLDYAASLESGHSKQAPLGMVEVTLAEVQSWLDRTSKWSTKDL